MEPSATSPGSKRDFITTSSRWRTAAGTRIGDLREDAEAAENKSAKVRGCGSDTPTIYKRGRVDLYIDFSEADEDGAEFVTGFALAGRNGVLGCWSMLASPTRRRSG